MLLFSLLGDVLISPLSSPSSSSRGCPRAFSPSPPPPPPPPVSGSVKGRHADANNSLLCGTCGSESHEAFCPACREWDSFPGAKGESTLTCKSPRCRARHPDGEKPVGAEAGAAAKAKAAMVTMKFFQVYCEVGWVGGQRLVRSMFSLC